MGRLNEQGLQRLVGNIKEDMNNRIDEINTEVENTKDDIFGIKNELKKTENTKYTTSNGVKTFECLNDGYVDNIFMEGETLVNLWGADSSKFDLNQSNTFKGGVLTLNGASAFSRGYYTDFSRLKPSTTYTLVTHIISNSLVSEDRENNLIAINGNSTESAIETPVTFRHPVSTGYYVNKVTTRADFTGVSHAVRTLVTNIATSGSCTLQLVLLEGDHTDKDISYFEGLISVGQGDNIEVSTYGKNLLNNDDIEFADGYTIGSGGNSLAQEGFSLSNFIPIGILNKGILSKTNIDRVGFYDANQKLILRWVQNNGISVPYGTTYFRIACPTQSKNLASINFGSTASEYTTYKEDKKQISTTLRSLPNGVKDTIEKRGNKYYKIQRCVEIVLNGSENINLASTNSKTLRFDVSNLMGNSAKVDRNKIICDKFIASDTSDNNDYEHIRNSTSAYFKNVAIYISKSKLSTPNVEGFKAWLKTNLLTIVYELETPIITELPNFNPRTFADKTSILIDSGVMQGDISFDITNSLGSSLDVMKDKMSSYDNVASNFRNIIFSEELPTNNQGNDGDIWIKYI